MTDKIKEFSEWFKNLDESQKQTIIKIAAVVAAIGPALIAFGTDCLKYVGHVGIGFRETVLEPLANPLEY